MCSSSTHRDDDSESLQEGAVKKGSRALVASHSISHAWFLCGASETLSQVARAGLVVLGAGTWVLSMEERQPPAGELLLALLLKA